MEGNHEEDQGEDNSDGLESILNLSLRVSEMMKKEKLERLEGSKGEEIKRNQQFKSPSSKVKVNGESRKGGRREGVSPDVMKILLTQMKDLEERLTDSEKETLGELEKTLGPQLKKITLALESSRKGKKKGVKKQTPSTLVKEDL